MVNGLITYGDSRKQKAQLAHTQERGNDASLIHCGTLYAFQLPHEFLAIIA